MNNSGSKESKTSIFDLKWNYNVKPSFIIAITKHKMNFTIVELPKIKKKINNRDSEVAKWMFALRYLNNLKGLPPALNMGKFKGLLEFAKISRFSKEELERYRYAMHMEWDDYAEEEAFIEDHPKFIKKIEKRLIDAIKQKMQKNNLSKDVIKKCLSLTTPNGQPH